MKNEINLMSFLEIQQELENLQKINQNLKCIQIGQSSVKKFPIFCIEISYDENEKPIFMLIGGTHGNEAAGIHSLIMLLREIAVSLNSIYEDFFKNYRLVILPCLNPEGYVWARSLYNETGFWGKYGRENEADQDIGRDLLTLDSSEATALLNAYHKYDPVVVISLHEFAKTPLAVARRGWWRAILWDMMIASVAYHPNIDQSIQDLTSEIHKLLIEEVSKTGNRVFDYSDEFGRIYRGHLGASGSNYFGICNSISLTFETSGYDEAEITLKKRANLHLAGIKVVFKYCIKNKNRILSTVKKAKLNSKSLKRLVFKSKPKIRKVSIKGKMTDSYTFKKNFQINGKKIIAVQKVVFQGPDYEVEEWIDVPEAYVIYFPSTAFKKKLSNHGIFYEEINDDVVHKIIVKASQPYSRLIPMLLDPRLKIKNRPCLDTLVELSF